MPTEYIPYYIAYIVAVFLARSLGPLFYIPMILDMLFNLALNLDLLSGWDIRLLIVGYGLALFIWVIALLGTLSRSLFVSLLVLDLYLVVVGIMPSLQAAGTGQEFWNTTSTTIFLVWQISITGIVLSMVIKSTVIAKLKGKYVDILTNPKKRFSLPIGAWAAFLVICHYFESWLPDVIVEKQYDIAGHLWVLGWIALELPFYLMYRRMKKRSV